MTLVLGHSSYVIKSSHPLFRLYGDEALDNALNTFVKLLLSIPQSDLLVSLCAQSVLNTI